MAHIIILSVDFRMFYVFSYTVGVGKKPLQNRPTGFVSILKKELEGVQRQWDLPLAPWLSVGIWAWAGVEKTVRILPSQLGGDQSDVQTELGPPERSAVQMHASWVESLMHKNIFQSPFLMRKEARDANQITCFIAMSELDISFGFSPDLSWEAWVEPFLSWHFFAMAQAARLHRILHQLPS